jgi:adenosylmethionine---8-amino-7-oxononanoate aminotransferase
MSFHYWLNSGKTRKTKFVTLGNSYHGETLAALAVGDVELYKKTYQPLLMETIVAPSPDCYHRESGESWEHYSLRKFAEMRAILERHHDEVCAVIVEPLVQCAGNMRMYHPIYLKKLREACDHFGVHLIADEIAVGFGRTGTLFACEQAGITPDFMCLSKGLTGGYLPLCAVLTRDSIYQAFYDDYQAMKGFLHSHSYTGNPLACAAALATLDIFEQDDVIAANQKLIQKMTDATAHFADHPQVAEVRQTGMILAIELAKDKANKSPYPWQERRGLRVYQYALQNRALLRPLGNVVYFMPPYVITEEQIDYLADVAWRGIEAATADN